MKTNSGEDARNVVPRWRPNNSLPKSEIKAVERFPPLLTDIPEALKADLTRWRKEGTLEAAIDIFETGLLLSDKKLIAEASAKVTFRSSELTERVVESLVRACLPEKDYNSMRVRSSILERDKNYIYSTISMYKRRAIRSRGDAIAYLELARLHTILGQYGIAERYLRMAIQIDPNGRAVLRAAVQFYQVVGEIQAALPLLRRSDSIRRDPWLQSAEIAAADLAKKGSHFAKSAALAIRGASTLEISKSELALAVATLDFESGVRAGKVFKLVEAGLANSTENAVAQGVWLGDQTNRSLHDRFPSLSFADDAHEAKARYFFEIEQYEASCTEANLWLQDQPFQSEPFCWIANTMATHLDNSSSAVGIAVRFAESHHNDWHVLNCCILIFATSGEFGAALDVARAMARLAHNDEARAFSDAAFGMIAMRTGDRDAGRAYYESAIRFAKSADRRDLVFSAYTFYLWGEAIAGQCNDDEIKKGIDIASKAVKKLPYDSRSEADKSWKSIKSKIETILEQRNLTSDEVMHPNFALPVISESQLDFGL